MKVVSIKEMQEMDRWTIEDIGIPSIILMENAGREVSKVAMEMVQRASGEKIAIFCGIGNNGGDGFVAARYLAEKGMDVSINIVGEKTRIRGDPKINQRILEKMGIKIREIDAITNLDVSLVIDAIFGIGLRGEVKEPVRSIIMDLNKSLVPIISVDVPSGLDADTGEVLGEAIKAKKTVTMQFPKKGFYINQGPEHVGEIVVVDIGIPEGLCVG